MKSKKKTALLAIALTLFTFISYFYFLNEKFQLNKTSLKHSLSRIVLHQHDNERKSKPKVNACIIVLLRNSDLSDFIKTIHKFEKNFNQKHNYPYVLMNNEQFTDEFRNEIIKHTKSKIEFALIPRPHWSVPSWIDKEKFSQSLKQLHKWPSEYRQMCRFFSGFFFRHELTLKYDFFMRLDSHVHFPCEFAEDPFEKLIRENKKYGFILTNDEALFTIPTLWDSVMKWNANGTKPNSSIVKFIKDSMCIFYNNF